MPRQGIHPLIWSAIAGRRLIAFTYDGRPRVVEPHTFGTVGDARELLSGYQIDGASDSGAVPGWRAFDVGKIADLSLGDEFAGPRPGYQRDDSRFVRIIAQL